MLKAALGTGVGFACLFVSDQASLTDPGTLVTQAEARIGRPLTPMSYAGVARRTTRRAVYGAAAVGAVGVGAAYAYPYAVAPVVAAPVVVAPACYAAVDAYGRAYTRCL